MLARYNSLANRGLYEACALLPDAELKAPRPAFPAASTAPHHLMVTDRIYLARFAGEEVPSTNSTRSSARCSSSSWRRGRVVARIEGFTAGTDERFLGTDEPLHRQRGKTRDDPAYLLVAHFLNHRTESNTLGWNSNMAWS